MKKKRVSALRFLPGGEKLPVKKRLLSAGCMVLVLLAAFASGRVYGRYVHKGGEQTGTVTAKAFYYTSNALRPQTESMKTYVLSPGVGGTTSFTFELMNYANSLSFSELDIETTVIVTNTADPTDTRTVSAEVLTGGADNVITVTLQDLVNGQTYLVEAVGTAGYKETLQATLRVDAAPVKVYKYLDVSNDHYVDLMVWTENVTGQAEITYPGELLPDNTDDAMATWLTTGSGTVIGIDQENSFAAPYATHTYRFFREIGNDYTAASFTASVGGTTAVFKEP